MRPTICNGVFQQEASQENMYDIFMKVLTEIKYIDSKSYYCYDKKNFLPVS